MEKLYKRTYYENSPSKNTPLNKDNLNNMEEGIDKLDDRIIEQDAAFAKSIEEEDKKIAEVNGKVSGLTETAATLAQSKSPSITVQKSGTTIIATDSADAGFEQFKTLGWGKQEKTSGNQLLPLVEMTETQNGLTLTVEGSTISVKGTPTDTSGYTSFDICNVILNAGTYFIATDNKVVGIGLAFSTATQLNFAMSETFETKTETLESDSENSVTVNVSNENGTVDYSGNWMLNSGSTALGYEPYTNGPSPNPEYPQPIVGAGQMLVDGVVTDVGIEHKLTGKNLLDISHSKILRIIGVGCKIVNNILALTKTADNSSVHTLLDIAGVDELSGHSITMSVDMEDGCRICLGYADSDATNRTLIAESTQGQVTMVVDGTNYKGKRVVAWFYPSVESVVGETTSFKNIQLEYGTVATEYEPYTEQTHKSNRVLNGIPLGQTIPDIIKSSPEHMDGVYWDDETQQYYIGDTRERKRGVDVQRVGIATDEDNWYKGSTSNTLEGAYSYNLNGLPIIQFTHPPVLCTHYTQKLLDPYWAKGDYISTRGAVESTPILSIASTAYTTLEEFTKAIEGMIVYYILATPIETPLTDEEIAAYKALHSNKPTTIITNDAGCMMAIEYVADPKNHIEQNYVPVTAFNDVLDRISALEQLHV